MYLTLILHFPFKYAPVRLNKRAEADLDARRCHQDSTSAEL